MARFHSAHTFYGESRYDLTAELFPPQIDNTAPKKALPEIQACVNRQVVCGRSIPLQYGFVPGFKVDDKEISPPFHVFWRDGVHILYRA